MKITALPSSLKSQTLKTAQTRSPLTSSCWPVSALPSRQPGGRCQAPEGSLLPGGPRGPAGSALRMPLEAASLCCPLLGLIPVHGLISTLSPPRPHRQDPRCCQAAVWSPASPCPCPCPQHCGPDRTMAANAGGSPPADALPGRLPWPRALIPRYHLVQLPRTPGSLTDHSAPFPPSGCPFHSLHMNKP